VVAFSTRTGADGRSSGRGVDRLGVGVGVAVTRRVGVPTGAAVGVVDVGAVEVGAVGAAEDGGAPDGAAAPGDLAPWAVVESP
jgi:hypothetical protein